MDSANHHEEVKKVTATELVEVLNELKEEVCQIQYLKRRTNKEVHQFLETLTKKDIKDEKKLKRLVNQMIKGEKGFIVGHLVNNE